MWRYNFVTKQKLHCYISKCSFAEILQEPRITRNHANILDFFVMQALRGQYSLCSASHRRAYL
jgi:hypothetical protein